VSTNAAGTDSLGGRSIFPAFSPDGTKVAFTFGPPDPVPVDLLGTDDVYVRDLTTGTTTLVSVDPSGTSDGDDDSWAADFSPDGTKVVFASEATNLGVGYGNHAADIFVRDLAAGTTTLVSVNAAGTDGGNSASVDARYSPDGTKILFESYASDLGPTDTNNTQDTYLRDLVTGTTTLVTHNAAGTDSANGTSGFDPEFSPDGTHIVFVDFGSDVVANDGNGTFDVFVHEVATGTNTLVSTDVTGTEAAEHGGQGPRFAPDGETIVFTSEGADLVADDTNGAFDVFAYDLATGTNELLTTNAAGTGSAGGASFSGELTADGTKLLFTSSASDLGPTDTNDRADVYLRDLTTGTTTLVSANAAGTDSTVEGATNETFAATFSPDERQVVFASEGTGFGPTDTNGTTDVYARHLDRDVTTLVSANATGTNSGNGPSYDHLVAPAGGGILFLSRASNLGPVDTNRAQDIYLARFDGADLSIEATGSPEPVASGGELAYQITATNSGPDEASDASAALLLPTGTTYVDAQTSTGTCAPPGQDQPRLIVCQVGDLAPDGEVTVTITATVTASAGATLSAIARVQSTTADFDDRNEATHVDSTVT
jgi:uncharacterized repeat protein (TIGR01451 family)